MVSGVIHRLPWVTAIHSTVTEVLLGYAVTLWNKTHPRQWKSLNAPYVFPPTPYDDFSGLHHKDCPCGQHRKQQRTQYQVRNGKIFVKFK